MATAQRGRERSLLSASTILILSAFLVGVALGGIGGPEFSSDVLVCGLTGFVGFIGLELSSQRRYTEALEQDMRNIENRLDRHVKPPSNPGFVLPAPVTRRPREAEFLHLGVRAD